MPDVGLVFACAGCCCGHPESGGPRMPPRQLKAAVRRAFKAAGLAGTVRLSFTECLGPCREANVVFVYVHGRPLWFRRMNSPGAFSELFDYGRRLIAGGAPPPPAALASRSFSWAGGGAGPVPPVAETA